MSKYVIPLHKLKNRAPPEPPKKVLTPFFLYRNDVFQ